MAGEYEEIRDVVRVDPESVWDRLSRLLCASPGGPWDDAEYLSRVDLIEELMFWHADAFIERLETLVEACPQLRMDVSAAYVGGVAVGPGLERFYALQESISGALEATGDLVTWRDWAPLDPPSN